MNDRQFSQPSVVYALSLAVAKLNGKGLSARILADALARSFPDVPNPALRVMAAKVLRLYFEPVSIADMGAAGLEPAEEAEAAKFFGDALLAEADGLRQYVARRNGANVVRLS